MSENFKENIKPFIFIIIVLALTAITAHSQRKFGGTVTEVIDGKTCVIQLQSGKVTVVLQYIEIPEPEQPLYQTVKDHFQKLVLEKQVEFLPRIVMNNRTVGQLLVKGVDISQQMLRDGAAWYSVPEKSGQDQTESRLYQENETQARGEKRGVWGVENLKPSWEFRAEQVALQKRQQEESAKKAAFIAEMQNQKQRVTQPRRAAPETQMWADVKEQKMPTGANTIGGLLVSNDPSGKFSIVATPSFRLYVGEKDAPEMTIGIGYFYADAGARGVKSEYLIAVESESPKAVFLKENSLVITADKQKIVIGKAKHAMRKNEDGVKEILTYFIKRDVIEKIADAENVEYKIGSYSGTVGVNIQTLLQNLLNSTR